MALGNYLKDKKAFIFGLDDVLYPQKDYLLQVYYLFAQFVEYAEQINADEIIKAMQQTYFTEGAEDIFDKTAKQFTIPEKYKINFDLLMHSARLPLKLLIFKEILSFLQEIVIERKQIFLFVEGDPAMQLNKIKQLEWNGLEKYLTVYFAEEISGQQPATGIEFVIDKHHLKKEDVLLIGKSGADEAYALEAGVDFLFVDKLLVS